MAVLIEMPFGTLSHMGTGNLVLYWRHLANTTEPLRLYVKLV